MATGVGLYIGATQSVAVVTTPGAALRTVERNTVLTPKPDGSVELGTRSEQSVEGFVERIGDTEGIRYAGATTRAEDLIATAMFCLFRDITPDLAGDVDVVTVHPSGWADDAVAALRESLDYMGLQHAKLVSAEVAVAASTESYATDAAVDSAVSESRPGWAAAHGGALIASGTLLTRSDSTFDTESFPAVPREQPTAYSRAVVLPAAEYTEHTGDTGVAGVAADVPHAVFADAPVPEPATQAVTDTPEDGRRRPLLLAGAAAGALTLAGITLALVLGYSNSTDVPDIRDAQQAESSSPSSGRSGPIDFPTVTPEAVVLHEPSVYQEAPAPQTEEQVAVVLTPDQPPVLAPPTEVPPPPPATTTEPTETTTPDDTTTPPETTDPDESGEPDPGDDDGSGEETENGDDGGDGGDHASEKGKE